MITRMVAENSPRQEVDSLMRLARELVASPDPRARLVTVRALARLTRGAYSGSPSIMGPAVACALGDPRAGVRRRAMRALPMMLLEGEPALLAPLLRAPEPDIVEAAARRLWICGWEGADLAGHLAWLRRAGPGARPTPAASAAARTQ